MFFHCNFVWLTLGIDPYSMFSLTPLLPVSFYAFVYCFSVSTLCLFDHVYCLAPNKPLLSPSLHLGPHFLHSHSPNPNIHDQFSVVVDGSSNMTMTQNIRPRQQRSGSKRSILRSPKISRYKALHSSSPRYGGSCSLSWETPPELLLVGIYTYFIQKYDSKLIKFIWCCYSGFFVWYSVSQC